MIASLYLILLCALCTTSAQPVPVKPHIVFVFVDDWGYADVGLRNPSIKSPNFDMLINTDLLLDRHYVFKYC